MKRPKPETVLDLAPAPPAAPPPLPAPEDEPVGLECRACGGRHFDTVYTRPISRGRIRRRKQCRACGRRVTTTETIQGDPPPPRVVQWESNNFM